jgi:predicted nuclease of predicted toxin-antitoxin system
MKFIVDAQLPYGLKSFLTSQGHDAIHTDDLPLKAETPDTTINNISKTQERIVITKDADFLDSYYIKNIPPRLLLITTGNIVNKQLYNLFTKNIVAIIEAFNNHNLVELDNNDLIIHE